jgi:amino acid transporter
LDAKISITFSEEMDHPSVQSAFSISPNVTGNFTWNGSTMTFTTKNELLPGTTYFVKIEKSAKDAHGNALASAYSFSFITKEQGSSISSDAIVYLISILAILAIVVVVLFLLMKRKRPEEKESPPPEDEVPKKDESFKRPEKDEKEEESEKERAKDEGSSKETESERKQTTNGKA